MGSLSIWHWLVVLVIVVLIFGEITPKSVAKDTQDEPAKPAQVAEQKPVEAPAAKEEAKPEEKKQA